MKFAKFKEGKAVGAAVLITLCFTLVMVGSVVVAQKSIEGKSEKISEQADLVDSYESQLYKETERNLEIAKQVCEKYKLDFDTVTNGELTLEMLNYETALELKKDDREMPLYKVENSRNVYSLEVDMGDIYAFYEARAVIEGVCEEAGIDPEISKVADLTIEQLMLIQDRCYETSDHPKN